MRFIIKDAKDKKYLDRINEMISQREVKCRNNFRMHIEFQNRIPYTPNRNEREIIARLMEKTSRSGYIPSALPSILISSEPPPLFIAYPELEANEDMAEENQVPKNHDRMKPDTYSIESLLGVYQPSDLQIIIYEKGIRWLCDKNDNFDADWLFSVVLIHEIGHWITHKLSKPSQPCWPTDSYLLAETEVHEGWAQLITWWIAEEIKGEFKSQFEELNKKQSSPYRVFEKFKKEPIKRMFDSLEELRRLSEPATLQNWINIIGQ